MPRARRDAKTASPRRSAKQRRAAAARRAGARTAAPRAGTAWSTVRKAPRAGARTARSTVARSTVLRNRRAAAGAAAARAGVEAEAACARGRRWRSRLPRLPLPRAAGERSAAAVLAWRGGRLRFCAVWRANWRSGGPRRRGPSRPRGPTQLASPLRFFPKLAWPLPAPPRRRWRGPICGRRRRVERAPRTWPPSSGAGCAPRPTFAGMTTVTKRGRPLRAGGSGCRRFHQRAHRLYRTVSIGPSL
ncbi:hypothetical protein M885DRAFT_140647 [Pelagophyceae sp. CCMP2097]|nr:hypothetical protein M885DRAFT_140647 [Pelagophyceae sp. CCMP2097]